MTLFIADTDESIDEMWHKEVAALVHAAFPEAGAEMHTESSEHTMDIGTDTFWLRKDSRSLSFSGDYSIFARVANLIAATFHSDGLRVLSGDGHAFPLRPHMSAAEVLAELEADPH